MQSFDPVASAVIFGVTACGIVIWERQINANRRRARSSARLVRHLSSYSDWSDYSEDNELFIRNLPKVELHIHLDGTFDADFLWKYMSVHPESVFCLPVRTNPPWSPGKELRIRDMVQKCKSSKDFHKLCTCRGHRSLYEMLNCFEVFLPIVRGNLALIEELAFDFCRRQWEQKIVYTEVRYSPHLLAEGFSLENVGESQTTTNVTPSAVLEAVTRGLRRGCATFEHMTVNQILCGIAWRPDWAMSTVDLALLHQYDFPCAVVGVDIAAGEEHFDKDKHPDLFGPHHNMAQEAKRRLIPMTIHAGESTEHALENIKRAITEYGASRIGHGYRMTDSPEVMQLVRECGVHVEVCPTSSDETGGWVYDGAKDWTKHPIVTMRENGIAASLSSDDPAVFHTSLAWQYRLALGRMQLTRRDILDMNLEAVEAAWCSAEEKLALRTMILSYGASNGVYGVHPHSGNPLESTKDDEFQDRVYVSTDMYL